MQIETAKFGVIEVEEDKILHLPYGLAGFPGEERFVILDKEDTRPFCWLQCVDVPAIALMLMDPCLFKPDYSVDLAPVREEMGWTEEPEDDLLLYVVVRMYSEEGDNPEKEAALRLVANLVSPLLVNAEKRQAVQIVMYDTHYSYEHPVV
ncbi:flagellar assembly factor FliW [Desulfobotulus alkaliphilus]|uniref:Flagellar assembly factor FliW n=1 Tax=Desulfobotulus alkaliphilus TaxID=622671 RepID=A0A562RTI6_9BACT|nr:flagellar assembly protein FliW [Desulfobotulus alkaliphilus]TWI72382.1 flagellar assembly factor FliW [Desulfobotulus alkaliphilus]